MTLQQLESMRDSIKAQYDRHVSTPAAPGQDSLKHVGSIELLASIRTFEQVIVMERAELVKLPGSLGPVLVGV